LDGPFTERSVVTVKNTRKRLLRASVSAPGAILRDSPRGEDTKLGSQPGRGRDELAELRAHPERSIQYRYVVNLEDGRRYRMLTSRTLARFGLTPREYRIKWGLPHGQPLLAKTLLATRRDTARELGLGDKLQAAQRHKAAVEPDRPDDDTSRRAPRTKRGRRRSTRSARRAPVLTR